MIKWLTRVDYMKNAKYWLYFSIVLSVVSLVAIFALGLNKGIDFAGGLHLDVQYGSVVTQNQVSDAVQKSIGEAAQVQQTETKGGNQSAFLVTVPELNAEKKDAMLKELGTIGTDFKVIGEENVSGSVSNELTRNAAIAIIVAALLQIIYIWIRFQFKFGITAVLALVHDVVITLGLMAIFRIEINAPFVAAILTVLGYSMNDTVVVIDRIRENLPTRGKHETVEALATRSIRDVITRSLYTGVSVQIMLLALMILGGDTIRDFVTTMFIGITLGTYSSIFIASALWVYWTNYEEKHAKSSGKQKGKLKPSKA
ncbi:MAG TPA: protein translocase subunit SecF [Symbiobacteriaceae bacterium]|nr:protein translocase subunit SecF [Symbiobacteriaceae bacterium]